MTGGLKDIFECVVPSKEGLQASLHYFATESERTIEDNMHKVYGIRVEKRIVDTIVEAEEVHDVTTKYEDIIHLTELMYRNDVTPVTVINVVQDFIA